MQNLASQAEGRGFEPVYRSLIKQRFTFGSARAMVDRFLHHRLYPHNFKLSLRNLNKNY